MSTKDRETEIAEALTAALAGTGTVVEEVTSQAAGKRRLLRVTVARDVSGLDPADTTSRVEPLTLDEIADATRLVGDTLDTAPLMGDEPYVLEVSSFGVDQPLTAPDHFRRNVGRLLVVNTVDDATLTGRVLAVDRQSVTLAVDEGGDEVRVPFTDVRRARVEIEFSRREEEED